jgi:hypothetical protein
MSITAAGICLAVFTILGYDMVSHSLTAIRPISHLMGAISRTKRIGKPSYRALQWDQTHQQSKQNSQQFFIRLAHRQQCNWDPILFQAASLLPMTLFQLVTNSAHSHSIVAGGLLEMS